MAGIIGALWSLLCLFPHTCLPCQTIIINSTDSHDYNIPVEYRTLPLFQPIDHRRRRRPFSQRSPDANANNDTTVMFKPQKFALSFTCGSLMFMASFGILTGPMEHIKGMCAPDRMLFTTIYLGSMFVTLYLTCTKGGLQGYALVMISSGVQLLALLWYLVSFLPGGTMGLSIVMRAMVTMLKPILGTCIRMQAMCISTCIGWMTRS
mmetsp:Transcript_12562/g.34616  ORF Transcript_12562/g.34616 Transcript_12562/m.34616 type:complete len:207 (+) Transcript_12562:747-1367(+)